MKIKRNQRLIDEVSLQMLRASSILTNIAKEEPEYAARLMRIREHSNAASILLTALDEPRPAAEKLDQAGDDGRRDLPGQRSLFPDIKDQREDYR